MARRTQLIVAKLVWFSLCAFVLVFAWSKRAAIDTDVVVLWMLVVLTFPIALAVSALGAGLFFLLDRYAGIVVPGGFWFNLAFWVISVGGAYWFWFWLIPGKARREP
jgi:hypothetical protein